MERSPASLAYKGSIPDAIGEAQRLKKLFVVYISGEDEDSVKLEQSTLLDLGVAESISKYCVFLHLMQGSPGASQFSAIYPQKSVPGITAVGYTGVLLWQHEGCIDPQNLVGNIEKAWATFHIQETAATFLSAALASKGSERPGYSSDNIAPVEKGSSSTSDVPSTSAEKLTEISEHGSLTDPEKAMKQSVCETRDEKDTKRGKDKCADVDDVKREKEELSNSATDTSKEVLCSVSRDANYPVKCNDGDVSVEPQKIITSDESHSKTSGTTERMTKGSPGSSQVTLSQVQERNEAKKHDGLADSSNYMKSNDIHLNIRMPNGSTLQANFGIIDTLGTVKNYIDENQASGIGSYDLAIPYPRKVFSEQDMMSPLSELGFAGRQALIVVPHRRTTERPRGLSPNEDQYTVSGTDSSNSGGGYFGYVKWILSYMNPFSYLRGNASSSSSETARNDSLWQYQPNLALQNQLPGSVASRRPYSQNPTVDDNVSNTRRRTPRPFGSNIHTLRQNEDEGPSGDRNTFWNGNSTEYGGNDNK